MDRPTCATCPYYLSVVTTHGNCIASPPSTDGWPRIKEDDVCAVHPDFFAFIESRKATPPIAPPSGKE